MSKIKFDLETAKWIAEKAQNDISAFPVELIECDKCGAVFSRRWDMTARTVIDIDFHDAEEGVTE